MKNIFKNRLMALPLPLIALAMPGIAHAGAFYLQEQSVKAEGRAFSGEVADTGADSLWWNPASIGGLVGGDAAVGFSAILPTATVTDTGTTFDSDPTHLAPVAHNPVANGYVPNGSVAYGINKQVAVGLTITSPYSFSTSYAPTSFVAYDAADTRLRTYDIQPSVAWAANSELNLGVALNVERTVATLTNYDELSPSVVLQALHGSGWDVGFTVGAQWHRGPVTLGVSFKSAITHHLDGTLAVTGSPAIGTSATFTTPSQVILGGRYAVTSNLTLNAQAVRFGWSSFNALAIVAPINAALPEDYRDTWSYSVGADYTVNAKWTLRGGVQRDVTPTTNALGLRDARVPDGNRWNFALGSSYALSKAFTVDVAANYIAVSDVKLAYETLIAGTYPSILSGTVTGAHVVVLSIGGRLKF